MGGENSLDDFRRNDLARAAPGGEAVDDHDAWLAEGFLEGLLGEDVVHDHFGG